MPRSKGGDKDGVVARVIKRTQGLAKPTGAGRRSELFRLMLSRADEFATLAQERGWVSIADALTAEGVANGIDRPLTADRVRKTWWAVRRVRGQIPDRQRNDAHVPSSLWVGETSDEPRRTFKHATFKDADPRFLKPEGKE